MRAEMSNLPSKLGQIDTKCDKSGTFKDHAVYVHFHLGEQKCSETDIKKSQVCPIWGQSDTIWMLNLTSLDASQGGQLKLFQNCPLGCTEEIHRSSFVFNPVLRVYEHFLDVLFGY